MRHALLFAAVFVPMLFEARRSRRHERALRSAGAIEPPEDVYRAMQIVYPACFLAMIGEGMLRPREAPVAVAGVLVFGLGKVLKYWAIRTLGPRWTFRILVPPGAPRLATGPYRLMRHPNYAGVAGELAGVALMARAPGTGLLSLLVFGGLMLARIGVEERALGSRGRQA